MKFVGSTNDVTVVRLCHPTIYARCIGCNDTEELSISTLDVDRCTRAPVQRYGPLGFALAATFMSVTLSAMMRQIQHRLHVRPKIQGPVEITDSVTVWLDEQSIDSGLLTLFIGHTSASLIIRGNLNPDDMPAHIKGALTQTRLNVPISDGRLMFGRYQGVILFEHRDSHRERDVFLHLIRL